VGKPGEQRGERQNGASDHTKEIPAALRRSNRFNACRGVRLRHCSPVHHRMHPLNARIGLKQRIEQMILPDAVDPKISARKTLALKARFLKEPHGRRVGR
jgi:hypothetical protein